MYRACCAAGPLLFAFALVSEAGAAETAHGEILVTAHELTELVGRPSLAIIDIRPAASFAGQHLPGALNLPAPGDGRLAPTLGVEARLGELGLNGSEEIVVYAEPGHEAALCAAFLAIESAGIAVRILDGGLPAWRQQGGAIESGIPDTVPVRFAPRSRRATTLGSDEVSALLAAEGVTLLDLRTDEDWRLFEPSPSYSAGHIPNALPYDFRLLLTEEGRWPAREDGRAKLARLGPRPQTPVDLDSLFILYGDDPTDPRPAVGYTLLRLLGIEVHVYPEGWSGWTADESRPVVRIVTALDLQALQSQSAAALETGLYPRLPILDLRELRDWEIGHVPGAFPLSDVEFPRFLDLVLAAYWPDADPQRDPIILYCYGPDCIRSRRGTTVALRHGWRNVYWFRDGIGGWFEAGLPLQRDAGTAPWEPG